MCYIPFKYFSGSRILSSFGLVRGYSLSIIGVPSNTAPDVLLKAHQRQAATRAPQRLHRSRIPSTVLPNVFQKSAQVLYFYKSSKQNEPVEWREGVGEAPGRYFVLIQNNKGRPSRVGYKDTRLRPTPALTRELIEGNLDDEIAMNATGEVTTPATMLPETPNDIGLRFEPQRKADSASLFAETIEENAVNDELPLSVIERGARHIGPFIAASTEHEDISGSTLISTREQTLWDIFNVISSQQVYESHISFAPSWIVDEALRTELETNWSGAYEKMLAKSVPDDANIISSHMPYRMKENDDGTVKLKAPLVLYGNHDRDRFGVRRDSSSSDLSIVRLVISLGIILGFKFATADVKGACMESGFIKRTIFVRPPKQVNNRKGAYWRLLHLSYGIFEAGSQWLCAVESWVLS